MNAIIVGIEPQVKGRICRVVSFNRTGSNWDFIRQMVPEVKVKTAIERGTNILNAKVVNNELKGKTGDLNRFLNGVNKPLVIISEISAKGDEAILGYKVANFDGVVKNVTLKEILAYCERVTKAGGVPIQNAKYFPEIPEQKAHIKSYSNGAFIKEIIERKKSEHARPAEVPKEENNKALSKLEELFTPEQIKELKTGKQNGVDIRIYGNNKLTAAQMKIIREGLEENLNASLYADPEYSVDSMRYLRADLRYGVNIGMFMSPKYSVEQLSELDSGYVSGIDFRQYADPKLKPEEMAEIRLRLETKMWNSEQDVRTDKSWN